MINMLSIHMANVSEKQGGQMTNNVVRTYGERV